jgi:hypothetical protein
MAQVYRRSRQFDHVNAPGTVHYGKAESSLIKRQRVLENADAARDQNGLLKDLRLSRRSPKPSGLTVQYR